jgi:hypothetical protein
MKHVGGDRLTLKTPSRADRMVDLTGKFLMGAFGEAHNHNIPSGDSDRTIRTCLGGHPTALVRRNVANGGMTEADLDGGVLQPVRSRDDIDRVWSTRIKVKRGRELHLAR